MAPVLAEDPGRPVFYLGDLDRAGGEIERNARSVLERRLGRQLAWERLALTDGQIRDLAVDPIWRIVAVTARGAGPGSWKRYAHSL